jgi:hypothetical protein
MRDEQQSNQVSSRRASCPVPHPQSKRHRGGCQRGNRLDDFRRDDCQLAMTNSTAISTIASLAMPKTTVAGWIVSWQPAKRPSPGR